MQIKTCELFSKVNKIIEPLFSECEYPWQIISALNEFLTAVIKEGIAGFSRYKENILIGEDVKITRGATIDGPLIICRGAEIRAGALIRGNVFIGEGAVVGNSSEIKNSVLLDRAAVPHYNYVGDSILGYKAHLGAGAICSNLKGDGSNVTVRAEREYKTERRKLGAILGDRVEIGCSAVLNPGTVVGQGSRAYPLIALRGAYPHGVIIKNQSNFEGLAHLGATENDRETK